ETTLIQTIGRTARNVNAEVILYADTITSSMRRATDETRRRRKLQLEYNRKHHVTPQTIRKEIRKGIEEEVSAKRYAREVVAETEEEYVTLDYINELQGEMREAAAKLDFERAAELRDRLSALQAK
ncbi:MAG: UvrB/UvrC motif-containing protein, partial [Candidatus Brocadiales bacterium]